MMAAINAFMHAHPAETVGIMAGILGLIFTFQIGDKWDRMSREMPK